MRGWPAPAQQGFLLLEVLITIVLVGIGLLGLAGLQARTAVMEMEAYQRTQALILAQDMAERIAANKAEAAHYAGDGYGAGGTADCGSAGGYAYDLCTWGNALRGATEIRNGQRRHAAGRPRLHRRRGRGPLRSDRRLAGPRTQRRARRALRRGQPWRRALPARDRRAGSPGQSAGSLSDGGRPGRGGGHHSGRHDRVAASLRRRRPGGTDGGHHAGAAGFGGDGHAVREQQRGPQRDRADQPADRERPLRAAAAAR
ncbi:MAG: type IV pilus modification protein PilV [Betaproteobacteria bacterium]|nr:type IV pilus modification protein PilV [Betaproteobacteria bacterium]